MKTFRRRFINILGIMGVKVEARNSSVRKNLAT